MHSSSLSSPARVSHARHAARTIELVAETARSRSGSSLLNGVLMLGVTGLVALLGFLGLRLWLITTVQEPVGGQLEYLIAWCGLPPSLGSFIWMLTFGLGALTAWPLVKKFAFFATGIPWFCPKPEEWALLCAIPASALIPPVVQTLCPVREVDPAAVSWFYPDPDAATGQPRGRIGYLREADGAWRFYNVPAFLRETDAAPVQRVTPEVRQQWQQDHARLQEQERRRAEAERTELAVHQAQQRQHAERLNELRLETARQEAQIARAAEAVAAAEKARQEAEAARQQAAREAAARAQAEKARQQAERRAQAEAAEAAEERRARAQEEKRREEAEAARSRLQAAEDKRRQDQVAALLESGRLSAPHVPASLKMDAGMRSMPSPRPAEHPGAAFSIKCGLWRNIHVRGDRVEVWCDGPVALGADRFAPRTYPGGVWVRFGHGAQTIHAMPAGPGATHVRVRPL